MVLRMTANSPRPRTGTTNRKMKAIRPPITKAITNAKISISGQRMAMRIIIMYAFCTFVTSVVRRVTSEEVEKRSMFSKEYSCTL